MPLSIVKEDGSGVVGANTYHTVDEAISTLADWGRTALANSSAPAAELLQATSDVEIIAAAELDGDVFRSGQGLLFPRVSYADSSGAIVLTLVLPERYLRGILFHADDLARSKQPQERVLRSVESGINGGMKIVYEPTTEAEKPEFSPEVERLITSVFPPFLRARRA